ncbi:HdeD family acid-resistance protein [Bifidobacterium choerinum]|uniref:Membrane protein n=1 Tax=Bifidobacterium choerinum TaxID=35760 RepID=A0A087AI96_9BIFI|nr:DUF308 domain-containing protein [Bifidobacterium choerinum]ATU20392.1 hypothetical protein BcFMB_05065 [Bifidobacterium choerinum]KFI58496.1 membrane protein [Bifidobacterium choerinum]
MSNVNDSPNGNWSPFRLVEQSLPTGAKNAVRIAYAVIGLAALALGICLLVWPGKTLVVACIMLGIYFLISGIVRIVSSIVEVGLPAGWRVLGILIGIILIIGGLVTLRYTAFSTATLAIMFTLIVGICWILEGVMALAESWSMPSSGWAIAYAIISIIAGFAILCMPAASTVALIIFGGCAMIVMGIVAIVRAFTFGRVPKQN